MYYYYYSLVHVTCNITTLLKMCCDYRAPTHRIFHLQFDLYERSSCKNDTVVSVLGARQCVLEHYSHFGRSYSR